MKILKLGVRPLTLMERDRLIRWLENDLRKESQTKQVARLYGRRLKGKKTVQA